MKSFFLTFQFVWNDKTLIDHPAIKFELLEVFKSLFMWYIFHSFENRLVRGHTLITLAQKGTYLVS